jgi:hypothetical protein
VLGEQLGLPLCEALVAVTCGLVPSIRLLQVVTL